MTTTAQSEQNINNQGQDTKGKAFNIHSVFRKLYEYNNRVQQSVIVRTVVPTRTALFQSASSDLVLVFLDEASLPQRYNTDLGGTIGIIQSSTPPPPRPRPTFRIPSSLLSLVYFSCFKRVTIPGIIHIEHSSTILHFWNNNQTVNYCCNVDIIAQQSSTAALLVQQQHCPVHQNLIADPNYQLCTWRKSSTTQY